MCHENCWEFKTHAFKKTKHVPICLKQVAFLLLRKVTCKLEILCEIFGWQLSTDCVCNKYWWVSNIRRKVPWSRFKSSSGISIWWPLWRHHIHESKKYCRIVGTSTKEPDALLLKIYLWDDFSEGEKKTKGREHLQYRSI